MMTKGSIHQEDIKIINIYASNNSIPKYMKQKHTELREEIDNSTKIAGDFNNPLSIMDRTIKQKIKETEDLKNIINQHDLTLMEYST